MSFNLLSQLFGSVTGHKMNVEATQMSVSLIESSALHVLNVKPDVTSVLNFVETTVDDAITQNSRLTVDQKYALTQLINGLVARHTGN